jgi:NADP-dependent 3-hydroxy acid dehydrogenase YdfG
VPSICTCTDKYFIEQELQDAEKTAHNIEKIGKKVMVLKVDVIEQGEVEDMVRKVKEQFNKIGIILIE